jgi:hypothetical protein
MHNTQENTALALDFLHAQNLIENGSVQIENTQRLAADIAQLLVAAWREKNGDNSLAQSLRTLYNQELFIEVYVLLQQIHKQLQLDIPTALELAIHHTQFMQCLLNEVIASMGT